MRRRLGRGLRLGVLGGLLYLGGWASGSGILASPPAPVDTDAIRDARELLDALDDVEAKLHQGVGWVSHHAVLAQRHQQVSEIACVNAEAHSNGMVQLAERQRQRRLRQRAAAKREAEQARLHGRRLASATDTSVADDSGRDDSKE